MKLRKLYAMLLRDERNEPALSLFFYGNAKRYLQRTIDMAVEGAWQNPGLSVVIRIVGEDGHYTLVAGSKDHYHVDLTAAPSGRNQQVLAMIEQKFQEIWKRPCALP